jgi:hypothetical protein
MTPQIGPTEGSAGPTAVIGWRFERLTKDLYGKPLTDDIAAVWNDAHMAVVTQPDLHAEDLPSDVHGVPMEVLRTRIGQGRGGAGDIQERFLEIVINLWPLASSGYVGAMSADAWAYTKKGVKAALQGLFHRVRATKVRIDVADDSDDEPFYDDRYVFEPDALDDIDRALDQLAANVISGGTVVRTTTTTSIWDRKSGAWVPQNRIETVTRVGP